ncbi:Regulator of rDNA transcription protein 5 [Yamadazyma tenuis]|uniref:RRM domain-containing protein n=1 Tax=Candida tenuis (strain ATCC 10573 / BCRC 21748 / CBS 615 / JCM 9827 / NBRC 10315 / NRRL Y-1498 / VKM Y-70) TaxID=590646 RepID=G3BAP9_CANTC|nr:uncharacterized protein CANTEDRAFT_94963 [Yamadazyma tenuis ATCC 10573]EGV62077.1 hypothetical protein CANTEDRAFT_94963 [Yamadazyma tenuis ATCC 10573]WEJ93327.1 Regulator of rDNA transcription protein 5 [Yamadazyma tenuis]
MSTDNIVQIKNVDYYGTEEELTAFLSEFKLKKVIILNYTVAYRTDKRRPLGVAIVEFVDADEAKKAVKLIHGIKFRGRTISAKLHVPFVPKPRRRMTVKKDGEQKEEEKSVEVDQADDRLTQTSREPTYGPPEVSTDTVYIVKIKADSTDNQIREFFQDYSPQEVFVFTERAKKRGLFSRNHKSALVSLKTEKLLEEVIGSLKGKALNGKKVELKAAFMPKVRKVKAADQKRKEALAEKSVEGEEPEPEAPEESLEVPAGGSVSVGTREVEGEQGVSSGTTVVETSATITEATAVESDETVSGEGCGTSVGPVGASVGEATVATTTFTATA